MIYHVYDTAFELYQLNIKNRSEAAIKALNENGVHYNRQTIEESILSFIKWDEFTKTRLPSIIGLHQLENLTGLSTHSSSIDATPKYVYFSNNHLEFYKDGNNNDLVSASYSNLLNCSAYPRIGLENGLVDSIEKFIFLYYSDHKIVFLTDGE